MGNLPKSFLHLLFAVLLSFASMGAGLCEAVPQAALQPEEATATKGSISESEQIKFQLLHSENLVSPVNNQSAPQPNNRSIGLLHAAYFIEHRIQDIATQYLLQAKGISCSLTSNAIIFPFHYFW